MFPAEVLIADPSAEWMRLAVPLILQEDWATSRTAVTFFARDGSAAYEGHATKALRTIVEDHNGTLQLSATITNLPTQQNQQVISIQSDVAMGMTVAVNQLAKRIDDHAESFPTKNLQALKAFTSAAATQDLTQRLQLLTEAVSADESFGLAHIALVETAAQVAPQTLPSLVASGTAHRDQFAPLERARWDALVARYSHASLSQQTNTEAAVLRIAPNNIDALATLGASRFLQGNGREGERLLRQTILLSPGNINLQLQLANGLIESSKFKDAVTILTPLANNAVAVPALATALLLDGKTKEATAVFQNLIRFLPPNTPAAAFVSAQWEAISTRKAEFASLPAPPAMAGYSAFLNGRFEEAVQFWQNAVQQTGDTDLRARAMLAASLNGVGRTADSNKVLVIPFVPDLNDGGIAVAFNQMRQRLKL